MKLFRTKSIDVVKDCQHFCRKKIWPGQGAWLSCNFLCNLFWSPWKNFVRVSFCVDACRRSPKMWGARTLPPTPLGERSCVILLKNVLPHTFTIPNLVGKSSDMDVGRRSQNWRTLGPCPRGWPRRSTPLAACDLHIFSRSRSNDTSVRTEKFDPARPAFQGNSRSLAELGNW